MTDEALVPTFEIVGRAASVSRAPRRARRNWQPIIGELVGGKALFMTDEELSESNLKYLMLAMNRRGKGEKLHTERAEREGKLGRRLWVDHE